MLQIKLSVIFVSICNDTNDTVDTIVSRACLEQTLRWVIISSVQPDHEWEKQLNFKFTTIAMLNLNLFAIIEFCATVVFLKAHY